MSYFAMANHPSSFSISWWAHYQNFYQNRMQSTAIARIFHESPAATTDMAVLPGVLGCQLLRRTVQVRLGTNTLRLSGGTPIFMVSRRHFMKYPG